jgi:hypothetical protein
MRGTHVAFCPSLGGGLPPLVKRQYPWREEFLESMRNVPPERIAKIRAMIAPWPGTIAPREVEDKQD